ncbi:MAG: alpha/beta fold hydrolase [Anaerolineae bacterium]|nr:alpha/beta fold hydrolase [Anaerolineae bacterium]MBL6965164.1 alpha/beta fold hydrolase [Anaerolineales bacterium]
MAFENTGWSENNPNLHNPHFAGDAFIWQAGPVGVFLSHGFTATTAEIRPLAKKFHARGYTVAAPLLPGHGTKIQDLNRVDWQAWVSAGQAMLAKLFETCEQVFVAGESMGGLLSLYLSSQEPRIAGVLLYAPAIRTTLRLSDYVKLYLGASFVESVGRASLDRSDLWQGYPDLPLKGTIQFLRFQAAVNKRLSHIHQPVLIFQGRKDTTVVPEAGELLMNAISSAVKEHHWMENSSHVIVLDVELEQVAATSIQFIERIKAG